MFIGRDAELERLQREYEREDGAFVPIYGRRRVGKSELILRFLRDRPGLYYLGKSGPALLQIREFLQEAARVLAEPLLAELSVTDWKSALTRVVERWDRPDRLVIALDEFQWMVSASPELPSVLQELWDREWRGSSRVMLILCGSYVGFMEREVLGRKSPLFGRRTAQILLRPFDYQEAAAFHRGWSLENRTRAWFVCGGVPLYHRFFSADRSVEQNLREQLLDEFSPLFREPEFLLREELRDVENYHAVLMAIATGHHTTRAISKASGLPERSLHYWIGQLTSLGYIGRRHPLTQRPPAKRHVRYVLEDGLLGFWFRFVYPNLSHLHHRGARATFNDRIHPNLSAYWGRCFERLCRTALPRLYAREGVDAAFEVGEYWNKDVQIDLVGLRQDGWTDLGECNWGRVRSLPALRRELEAKIRQYPNPRNATIGRRFFARRLPGRRGQARPSERWYDLEDLYRK